MIMAAFANVFVMWNIGLLNEINSYIVDWRMTRLCCALIF
jgi:hypothetical protein